MIAFTKLSKQYKIAIYYKNNGEIKNMSKSIQLDLDGKDITCMKEFDALKYPCRECDREDCDEREEYEGD